MKCIGIAVLVMVAATTGVHLGLPQAIAGVVVKVCRCHKCLTFWLTLGVLIAVDCPLLHAALLSLLMAYASHWFSIALIWMNKMYEKLWEKVK